MADITDQHDQTSPTELDESQSVGNGSAPTESRGIKRQRPSAGDDDDDDDEKGGRERRKIEIKFISDKSRRHITFSKRKAGIMKKVRLCLVAQNPPLFASEETTALAGLARLPSHLHLVLLLSSHHEDEMPNCHSGE